jgi:hypothetical protein
MPVNSNSYPTVQGQGLPIDSGQYLVALREHTASEYCPLFQVADFDALSRTWRAEVYQPDEGTMEPTDLTNSVMRWWQLPSA